nr:MAG TPA: hypothetical protein [Bacteriophage sp.]
MLITLYIFLKTFIIIIFIKLIVYRALFLNNTLL